MEDDALAIAFREGFQKEAGLGSKLKGMGQSAMDSARSAGDAIGGAARKYIDDPMRTLGRKVGGGIQNRAPSMIADRVPDLRKAKNQRLLGYGTAGAGAAGTGAAGYAGYQAMQ